MQLRTDFLPQGNDATINTIYIGGGTPSQISRTDIDRLFNNIYKVYGCKSSETTVEVNPDDVDSNLVRCLVNNGVNRVSMGAQTFDDERLRWLHRRHSSKQVYEAVDCLRQGGIARISVDLMYGFPNQTAEQWQYDIDEVIKLGVEHVSAYSLMYEEGTPLYRLLEKHEIKENDEELSLLMYNMLVEQLRSAGYEHYEVSNFSRPNYNSRHNLNYWNNEEYYGFGVAAHGYQNGIRYGNIETIEEYLNNPIQHKEEKLITPQERLEEEIFLGFREMKGIMVSKINCKYGIDFEQKYQNILNKYLELKLIQKTQNGYSLTPNGILVSNVILADFLEDK